eukprot:3214075-Alexandrium_andersonii.AAC.1
MVAALRVFHLESTLADMFTGAAAGSSAPCSRALFARSRADAMQVGRGEQPPTSVGKLTKWS